MWFRCDGKFGEVWGSKHTPYQNANRTVRETFKGHQYVTEVTAKKGTKLASENVKGSRKEPSSWHGRARGCNQSQRKASMSEWSWLFCSGITQWHVTQWHVACLIWWPWRRSSTEEEDPIPSLFKNCKLQAILSASQKWRSITYWW